MTEQKAEYALQVQTGGYIAPAVTLKDALIRYQMMKDFVSGVLQPSVDFGIIPGTSNKPTLLKPGAEKLASFFGLRPIFSVIERVDDWTGENHGGEPFFLRDYKAQLYRNGELIGEGCGSCNSWESKYRYRNGNRKCPKCGNETIIKGKEDYGGGWLCFAKKGGCGAKFKDNDQAITGQDTGKIKNPDIFDQVNTIDKMAQKRALIAAVLIATNASDYFTQDVEDFIDGDYSEMHEQPVTIPNVEPVIKPVVKPEPELDLTPVPLDTASKMSLEMAETETNSKGVKYGDIETDKLTHMYNAMSKLATRTDEHARKMAAIQTILQARADRKESELLARRNA